MADAEAPSFSLGLDFDVDPATQSDSRLDPSTTSNFEPAQKSIWSAAIPSIQDEDGKDDDVETPTSERARPLKRLRHGPSTEPTLSKKVCFDVDDDIEEFSSQEDQLQGSGPKHPYSVCRSSKLSLRGQGVLSLQKPQDAKGRKTHESSNVTASATFACASNKAILPELTISPLRKFQLIDSDSEGNSLEYTVNQEYSNVIGGQSSLGHVPTPAFDKALEEHFESLSHKNGLQNHGENCSKSSSLDENNVRQGDMGPLPPAHQYYFHKDPRIQRLVCARLPNFFPLHAESNLGHKQQNACAIDYMSQFSRGESSKQAKQKESQMPSTSRRQKNARKTVVQELADGSHGWVNPKSCSIPKDAGKRRVQAVGKSGGHWYTNNGRRAYVAKNGHELTGQSAYRQYRKESGAGFKKPKKKTSTEKKAAPRKK